MPELRCNDMFTINYDWTKNTTTLVLNKTGETFDDYSLYVHNDSSYSADVCRTPTNDPAMDW